MRLRCVTVLSVGLLGVLCQPVGGQGGRADPFANVPLLPYKLVEWPTLPTSAAGAPAPWNFIQVSAAAVARSGRIVVLHRGAHPIMEFESGGAFVRSWGDGTFSEGKVAAIPQTYWTADKSHYSAVYGPAGCTSCGAHSVRVDPQGNLWFVDASGHVLYKTTPDGKEMMRLGTKGVAGGESHRVQPADRYRVRAERRPLCDRRLRRRTCREVFSGRQILLQWGKRGTGPGGFGLPHNLVVDAKGRVYVTDRDHQRVQVFEANGTFVTEWTGTGGVSGLAITKDQRIWTGGILRELDGKIVGKLSVTGAHGVAIADSGDVYLAQLSGIVQKFVKQ